MGGALAVSVMLSAKQRDVPLPAGAALLSPWVDLASTGESVETNAVYDWGDRAYLQHWARLYLGDTSPVELLASPAHADLHGLPPLLIQVGDAEVLLSEVQHLAARAEQSDVDVQFEVYPDMVHGFQMMASAFASGEQAIAALSRWYANLERRRSGG